MQPFAFFINAIFYMVALASATNTPIKENRCGHTTVIKETSGISPTAYDCQTLALKIMTPQSWTFWRERELVRFGSCAFGAETLNGRPSAIGNQDVIDLIYEAMGKCWWRGRMGARGRTECGGVGVEWRIYRPRSPAAATDLAPVTPASQDELAPGPPNFKLGPDVRGI